MIIPCYNEEQYIGQAIGSIIEQTRPADEIIVVDDGSDDRSPEIVKSFGKMVTVLSSGGGGAPKARNLGAEYALGDALMFFDADDVMGPHVLEALAEYLEKYPDGIAACPWFRLEKVDGNWVKQPRSCPHLSNEKDYLDGWIREVYHPPCSVLWSRTAYEKTGGWDPRISVNQDGDLMMRALADGVDLHITTKGATYYRRMPAGELSSSQSAGQFKRSGRESQIFVLKKIITKLEERGRIDNYRQPLSETLNKIRMLCQDQYPELAKECLELIEKYGEPRHIRFARKVSGEFRRTANLILDRSARTLTNFGCTRIRQILAHIKNKLSLSKTNGVNQVSTGPNPEKEKEIRFGLEAYRKASAE